jgi:hypothetical protein
MSTKFEQLLDLIVNEEHDKANELFHEIVVEKSREIYENLISEESEEDLTAVDGDIEEAAEEADESVDEGADEEAEESMDLEDSYMMDGDDSDDPADKLALDVAPEDDMEAGDDMESGDDDTAEDEAIMDIKNAIEELEAAFAELEQAQNGGSSGDDMDDMDDTSSEFGDENDEMEMMGLREYRETVGNDWEKNSQKTQGQYTGANTGEGMPAPAEGKSVINKEPSDKVSSGARAKNIVQGATGAGGSNTGTSPNKPQKGINPESGEKFAKGLHNVDGAKSGVKTLSKVASGHGAEKKGSGPGPVGSGTGDKAGQTSVRNDGSLIKHIK